jgi:hypothetical protein
MVILMIDRPALTCARGSHRRGTGPARLALGAELIAGLGSASVNHIDPSNRPRARHWTAGALDNPVRAFRDSRDAYARGDWPILTLSDHDKFSQSGHVVLPYRWDPSTEEQIAAQPLSGQMRYSVLCSRPTTLTDVIFRLFEAGILLVLGVVEMEHIDGAPLRIFTL